MRKYRLRAGDTLRDIARSQYYVYDDQGNEDLDRVRAVVREIVKWNPDGPRSLRIDHDQPRIGRDQRYTVFNSDTVDDIWDLRFDPQKEEWAWQGTQIILPHIPGTCPYNPRQRSPRGWTWLYLLVWLIGVAIGIAHSLNQQLGATSLAQLQWPQQYWSGELSLWPIVSDALPWLCLWSLTMWGVWVALSPPTSSPVRRARQRFLVSWLFGFVVLLPGLNILISIVIPRAAPTLTQFNDLFPLVIIWTVVVFLLYLYLSDGSTLHAEYLVPHRGIWTVLALMLMGTILAGYVGYQQVTDRIQGELAALTLARSSLVQLRDTSRHLRDGAEDWLSKLAEPSDIDARAQEYMDDWFALQHDATAAALQARDAQAAIQEAIRHYERARSFLNGQAGPPSVRPSGAQKMARLLAPGLTATGDLSSTANITSLQGTDIDYLQQQIDGLEQMSTVVTATLVASRGLTPTLERLKLTNVHAITTTGDFEHMAAAHDFMRQAEDVVAKADVVAAAIIATRVDSLPIFMWNGVLYAVLVLFPWLLLLLFLYRKRVNLAAQIYDDLRRLDRNEDGLLKRVLAGSSSRRDQQRIDMMLHPQAGGPARGHWPAGRGSRGQRRSWLAPRRNAARQPEIETREQIIDVLAKRTFGEFEYLVSMVFLTLLLAVGWYYVFYPQTAIGLTFLIERGAGIRQMIAFITANLTPLTIGFAGAYFFLMQMLVRRYLSNDLYPTAFLQAALRLLVIVLLSLALTLLPLLAAPIGGNVDLRQTIFAKDLAVSGTLALLIAFLVGIFPTSGLKLIVSTVNRWVGQKIFPETLVPEPLTKLTGVTLWVEARLFEENIESVEAMATAQIEQLIVNTHFSTAQIVDWVDQAILYLHCGHDGEWFPQLRAVGIRGASDLLDAAGFNLLEPYSSLIQNGEVEAKKQRHEFCPDQVALQRLANAITEANASGVPQPAHEDPRGIAASAMEEVRRAADQGALQAKVVAELIGRIDESKPATYHYPLWIDDAVADARARLDALASALAVAARDAKRLASGPARFSLRRRISAAPPAEAAPEQSLLRAFEQLKAALERVQKAVQQIPAAYSGARPPAAADPGTRPPPAELGDPEPLKRHFEALRAERAAVETALNETAGALRQIDQAHAAQPEWQKLATAVAELRKQWQAIENLDKADQRAQLFDITKIATYDARAELADYAEQLSSARQTLERQLEQLRKVVAGTDITLTLPQSKTIKPALESAEQSVQALAQPVTHTFDYARKLWPHAYLAPAPVEIRMEEARQIGEAFASAHEKIQYLNTALATIVQPPQVTTDILHVICDSIWPDSNIAYVLNYNQWTICDLVGAPRECDGP